MSRPTWARWVTRISLLIALVALGFTIRSTGVATIGSNFRRIGVWWFAVIALECAITSLDATAIRAFMSPEQRLVKMRSALLAQLAGRSVNAVTPSGNLGEAVKVSVLTEHVSQSRAVATILIYNIVSFCVELGTVALAGPVFALLVPMPESVRVLMLVSGGVCLVIAVGLYALFHRGVLSSVARALHWIKLPGLAYARRTIWKVDNTSSRILTDARYAKTHDALAGIDDMMRASGAARRRDRVLGTACVIASRLTSTGLSLLILHAVGEQITAGFVAAYIVGGFVIYMLSTLVPMGLGISEGGNWWLFRALGEDPRRGVTLVIARRVTLVLYAAIGLVLLAASETVQRARDKHVSKTLPTIAPAPVAQVHSATPTPPG